MKKRIIITGSTGYIGQSLIRRLLQENSFAIGVISRDKRAARELLGEESLTYYEQEDCLQGIVPLAQNDLLLHLGFARPHRGNLEIAKSLEFTGQLFSRAAKEHIPAIINLSSRSVYSLETPPPWTEHTRVAPSSVYGQAKYASELLLTMSQAIHPQTMISSIRLGTVSGGGGGLVDAFVLTKFVNQAIKGEPLRIIGGNQEIDVLDIRDTVEALVRMLKTPPQEWKPLYNLCSPVTYTIAQMAHLCVEIAARFNGGHRSEITIEKKEVHMRYGMDSKLFYQDMQWQPRWKLEDIIQSLIEYYLLRDGRPGNEDSPI